MSTTSIGNAAEVLAASYLRAHGHVIIARNWRTKWCEIDIISYFSGAIYFNEVRYRSSAATGDGLDSITATKLMRMHRAAEMYIANLKSDTDYLLQVVGVSANGVCDVVELD